MPRWPLCFSTSLCTHRGVRSGPGTGERCGSPFIPCAYPLGAPPVQGLLPVGRGGAGAVNTVMLVAQPRGSELRIRLCGGEAELGLDVGGWAPDQRGLTLLPGPQQPPPFPEEHPDSELRRKLPNTS